MGKLMELLKLFTPFMPASPWTRPSALRRAGHQPDKGPWWGTQEAKGCTS